MQAIVLIREPVECPEDNLIVCPYCEALLDGTHIYDDRSEGCVWFNCPNCRDLPLCLGSAGIASDFNCLLEGEDLIGSDTTCARRVEPGVLAEVMSKYDLEGFTHAYKVGVCEVTHAARGKNRAKMVPTAGRCLAEIYPGYKPTANFAFRAQCAVCQRCAEGVLTEMP